MNTPASNVKALRDSAELDEAIDLINDALSSDAAAASPQVRSRLLGRVADSAARYHGLITVRTRHLTAQPLADGVEVRWIYRTDSTRPRRAGEPQRLALIELRPGARLATGLGAALQRVARRPPRPCGLGASPASAAACSGRPAMPAPTWRARSSVLRCRRTATATTKSAS